MYDYLIVGSGLYGAICARQLTDAGKSVLVIDKRPNIAGNVYTKPIEGINAVSGLQRTVLRSKTDAMRSERTNL